MAKALKQPVGVLCTSGTAAANFFPAVCEAKATNIPFTIAHSRPSTRGPRCWFATNDGPAKVIWVTCQKFVELALPEGTPEMLRYGYWHGANCAYESMRVPVWSYSDQSLPFRGAIIAWLAFSLDVSFHPKNWLLNLCRSKCQSFVPWLSKKD